MKKFSAWAGQSDTPVAPKSVVMIIAMLTILAVPAFAVSTYTVDGDISDWGVSLETETYWTTVYFDSTSFAPSEVGTIDYIVEDRYPSYSEYYDYEALYFDDTDDTIYVGVISSHAWNPAVNTILVTIDGVTQYAQDADEFVCANLNVDEKYRYTTYANYFIELSWSKASFGEVETDDPVYVYANCDPTYEDYDRVYMYATIDNPPGYTPPGATPIPEPMTVALLGFGLAGLGIRRLRSNRSKFN